MDQTPTKFAAGLGFLLDFLIPDHCFLCASPCQRTLCEACTSKLPRLTSCCKRCALPMRETTELCGECIQQAPSYQRAICAFQYRSQIPDLINQFKHKGKFALGDFLSEHLINALPSELRVDALVAVPLHWRRQLRRGFNQAELIAHTISRHTGLALQHPLQKRHQGPHQQGLTRKQRLTNARNTYVCSTEVKDKHLLLVDDVITTGATIEAIAALMKAKGAASVTACALARTPKPR